MSINVDALAITQFEAEVHQKFTAKAKGFQNLGRYKSNVIGEKVQWSVLGYSMMQEHVVGQPIKPANGSRAPVDATLKNYAIGDWTSIFLQQQINFSDQEEFAMVIADAMENRMIQEVINALSGATIPTTNQIAVDISGADANLTAAAIRAAANALDNLGVPEEDRIILTMPSGVHNLTKDPIATSSDFVTKNVMDSGQMPGFYGFNFKKIPDLQEGGLPGKGTDTRKVYAYGKRAVGIATGVWKDADAQYYNTHLSHFVSGALSGVAKVIDANGVVEITVKNAL